jgi:two-component system, cell cycle response regulator CpdR
VSSVLVVDDDPDVLEYLTHALQAAGHEVHAAGSGIEALDLLDAGIPFDLLLTDIMMPGLNGFNLARMARLRRLGLKIVYLSGYYEEALAMRDEGIKFGKILRKPIRAAELAAEVALALESKSTQGFTAA